MVASPLLQGTGEEPEFPTRSANGTDKPVMYADKVRIGWDLALSLRNAGDLNNSASRMYYAVFQAVLAYAVKKERFDREKHREKVHSEMKRVLKEAAARNKEWRDCYDDLRELRNRADYDPEDVTASAFDLNIVHQSECIKNFFLNEVSK